MDEPIAESAFTKVDAVTVQVVAGAPPTGVTVVIDGVPVMPEPSANPKSPATTLFTDSLKVTVHAAIAAFVGLAPTRVIDKTDGAVVSIAHVYDVGLDVFHALEANDFLHFQLDIAVDEVVVEHATGF